MGNCQKRSPARAGPLVLVFSRIERQAVACPLEFASWNGR
jgi:hypothetical protein